MKKSHRFDEEDLMIFLTEGMLDRGYLTADEEITGLEFRTKKVKKGGWYHEDASNLPDDQIEVIRWVKVHTAEKRVRRRPGEEEAPEETVAAEAPPPAQEAIPAPPVEPVQENKVEIAPAKAVL